MTTFEFRRTAATHRPGATTMPREFYTSPEIFAEERERIGLRQWHCVGRADRIAEPGQYFLRTIAGEPLIVLRDRRGALRAHFNVCRHRGTRLCATESGRFGETIQCPYHAWTYATDGRLLGAPHMGEAAEFRKADHGLIQGRIAEWDGFLFVAPDPEAPAFEDAFAPFLHRFTRFGLARLRSGHNATYEVRANWKLVFQNYCECLHCPTIHPELNCRLPYQSGANDLTDGPFLGGYMELTEGSESVTLTGKRAGPLIAPESPDDARRAYYYTAMPNFLLSIHPDYVNYYMLWPAAVDRTLVESEWLFPPEAAGDPAFDPDAAIRIWEATNRQDWHITEESQEGIRSRWYRPGPYSPRESMPAAWDRAYLAAMGRDR